VPGGEGRAILMRAGQIARGAMRHWGRRPATDRAGTLVSHPASSQAGDFIEFRAELDCLVVLSSCPMDIVPISAGGITPLDLTVSSE